MLRITILFILSCHALSEPTLDDCTVPCGAHKDLHLPQNIDYSRPGNWSEQNAYDVNGGQVHEEYGKYEDDTTRVRYYRKNSTYSSRPLARSAGQSADRNVQYPIDHISGQSRDHTRQHLDRARDQSIGHARDHILEQSIDHSLEQSVHQSREHSRDHGMEQSRDFAREHQSRDHGVEQSRDHAREHQSRDHAREHQSRDHARDFVQDHSRTHSSRDYSRDINQSDNFGVRGLDSSEATQRQLSEHRDHGILQESRSINQNQGKVSEYERHEEHHREESSYQKHSHSNRERVSSQTVTRIPHYHYVQPSLDQQSSQSHQTIQSAGRNVNAGETNDNKFNPAFRTPSGQFTVGVIDIKDGMIECDEDHDSQQQLITNDRFHRQKRSAPYVDQVDDWDQDDEDFQQKDQMKDLVWKVTRDSIGQPSRNNWYPRYHGSNTNVYGRDQESGPPFENEEASTLKPYEKDETSEIDDMKNSGYNQHEPNKDEDIDVFDGSKDLNDGYQTTIKSILNDKYSNLGAQKDKVKSENYNEDTQILEKNLNIRPKIDNSPSPSGNEKKFYQWSDFNSNHRLHNHRFDAPHFNPYHNHMYHQYIPGYGLQVRPSVIINEYPEPPPPVPIFDPNKRVLVAHPYPFVNPQNPDELTNPDFHPMKNDEDQTYKFRTDKPIEITERPRYNIPLNPRPNQNSYQDSSKTYNLEVGNQEVQKPLQYNHNREPSVNEQIPNLSIPPEKPFSYGQPIKNQDPTMCLVYPPNSGVSSYLLPPKSVSCSQLSVTVEPSQDNLEYFQIGNSDSNPQTGYQGIGSGQSNIYNFRTLMGFRGDVPVVMTSENPHHQPVTSPSVEDKYHYDNQQHQQSQNNHVTQPSRQFNHDHHGYGLRTTPETTVHRHHFPTQIDSDTMRHNYHQFMGDLSNSEHHPDHYHHHHHQHPTQTPKYPLHNQDQHPTQKPEYPLYNRNLDGLQTSTVEPEQLSPDLRSRINNLFKEQHVSSFNKFKNEYPSGNNQQQNIPFQEPNQQRINWEQSDEQTTSKPESHIQRITRRPVYSEHQHSSLTEANPEVLRNQQEVLLDHQTNEKYQISNDDTVLLNKDDNNQQRTTRFSNRYSDRRVEEANVNQSQSPVLESQVQNENYNLNEPRINSQTIQFNDRNQWNYDAKDEQKVIPLQPIQEDEMQADVTEITTERPGFWSRLGHKITNTYDKYKEKAKNAFG